MQTIRYDAAEWLHKNKGDVVTTMGTCELRLASPGAVFAVVGKAKKLIGYGDHFKITFPTGKNSITCSEEYAIKVMVRVPSESEGKPLTNFDKKPGGSTLEELFARERRKEEVTRAVKNANAKEANRDLMRKRKEKGLEVNEEPEEQVVENDDKEKPKKEEKEAEKQE